MKQFYLIDGYNLMHVVGYFPTKVERGSLAKGRGQLLSLVASSHRDENAKITIVFDARNPLPHLPSEFRFKSMRILFAVKHEEADDLIEDLIRSDSSPKQLTVVSSDRRLQQAAKRRRCHVLKCDHYLDHLERMRLRHRKELRNAAGEHLDLQAEERDHWLEEFADLDGDPAMKELFDPFRFGDLDLEELEVGNSTDFKSSFGFDTLDWQDDKNWMDKYL